METDSLRTLTPDKHHWYDQMIAKGFAEKDESYVSLFENGNPSKIFKQIVVGEGSPDKKLLDIGCGPGKYTEMFTPNFSRVVGLDRSANSINFGKNIHKAPNLDFIIGDAYNLPVKKETFEVVSSRLAPHSLTEMMRVLKPGGFAIAMRVGETDGLELRRLFGQKELVAKMDGLIVQGERHSKHIVDRWNEAGFKNVECSEHEYDMHFDKLEDLAKYLSRIPIVPEFDMETSSQMELLKQYAEKHTHPETGAVILHRHRYLIKGIKP